MTRPTSRVVLQDAYLAWTQGADETRGFPNFATWAMFALARHGYGVST